MTYKFDAAGWRKVSWILAGVTLALTLIAPEAGGQTPVEPKPNSDVYKTIFLANVTQQNDLNDIQTDLRNMLPKAKIYGVPSENAISLRASIEDINEAQKIIAELDRPRKIYRLTYTITETDGGKAIGAQHYSMIVTSGEKSEFKQGTRVPVVTGSYDTTSATPNSQMTYVDVGLSIDVSLNVYSDGVRLHSKVVQSGVAQEKSGVGAQDPLIRQTTLDGTSTLAPGKQLALGSMDAPGSGRHEEIAVVAELVK